MWDVDSGMESSRTCTIYRPQLSSGAFMYLRMFWRISWSSSEMNLLQREFNQRFQRVVCGVYCEEVLKHQCI